MLRKVRTEPMASMVSMDRRSEKGASGVDGVQEEAVGLVKQYMSGWNWSLFFFSISNTVII
jgi:hypothetical protein